MKYLLDSNTISALYDPEAMLNDCISAHVSALDTDDCLYISILSVYELEYGWANAPAEKQADIRQVITDIQTDFRVLGLSAQEAMVFGSLKKHLKKTRSPSKENMKKFNIDVMLASTAITHQIVLVSADTVYATLQHYDPSLQVVNAPSHSVPEGRPFQGEVFSRRSRQTPLLGGVGCGFWRFGVLRRFYPPLAPPRRGMALSFREQR